MFHIGLAKMNTPEIRHVLESLNVIREHTISIHERLTRIETSLQQPRQTRREIRFEQLDPVYTRLMNLACLRIAKQKIENRQSGIRQHLPIPYGQVDNNSMRLKIRNYMKAITNEGNFGGRPGNRYATRTIRVLVTLNPSYNEIDRAAEYYRSIE
jgi:hypothetical protein